MYDGSDSEYDHSELLQALRREEQSAATYLQSELQEAQIEALRRFYGDEYGDEVEGLSRVTTREVYETIQWLRPDLRRTFTAGDKVFEFEGVTEAADQYASEASDLVNHIFLNDNQGERELDAFIFDGLLQRIGIIAAEWSEKELAPAQEASGLNTEQVMMLMQDQRTHILGQRVEEGQPDEAHPDGLFYTLKIARTGRDARPDVFCIAPEDFRVSARTVDLEKARYCGDIVRMMRGEAKEKWPDHAEAIDSHQGETSGFNTDERRGERFRDLEGWAPDAMGTGEGEAGEVEILREYIRFDLNKDGTAELIRCYRLGDTLLECEEVDEHIYSYWTPIPIPHRLFGLSIYDEAHDIQRTKTVLLRSALNSVYQSVVPRMAADRNKVKLDDLLTVAPGSVITTEGSPHDSLMPVVTPDLSGSAFQAIQVMDRVLESRTGITRQAQGFDPDLLHDTAKGVELLQNAASVRKEEIARNLAVGLQSFGMKLYRLIHKHQNEARSLKIAGQWRNVDPRAWEADVRCTVSVGLGTGAKEKQLMMLQMIQADQVAYVQAYGPGTPIVTPQHMHNLESEKLRVMGFKSAAKFFGDPMVQNPETGEMEPFVPPPLTDPNQAKIEADMAMRQMEIKAQAEQTALQAEKDMQVAQAQQRDEMVRAEYDIQKETAKAGLEASKQEMEGERIRLEHERAIAQMGIEAEQAMAEIRLKERELELREMELRAQQEQAKAQLEDTKHERKERTKLEKMRMASDPDERDDAEAEADDAPSRTDRLIEAMMKQNEALVAELRRPKRVVRGPDGRAEGVE